MIKYENGQKKYFDRNGKEITEGCKIRCYWDVGKYRDKTVYLTEDGELGWDATNPKWVESGRAVPCEYGIYTLTNAYTEECEVIEE